MKFYTNVFSRGNFVYVRGYDKGIRFTEKLKYKPYIFLPSNKPTQYTTLFNEYVDKLDFDSIRDGRDFIEKYKDVSNFKYYGLTNFPYLYIYDNYTKNIEYDDSLISVVNIDIETSLYNSMGVKEWPNLQNPDNKITAITLTKNKKSVTFSTVDYKVKNKTEYYVKCVDEYDLIQKFLEVWESDGWSPEIVTGWNILGFDCIYISNRILRLFNEDTLKRLSPWKLLTEQNVLIKGKKITFYLPMGISFLDYMEVYKFFIKEPRESHKLDYISMVELNEQKLDYSEYKDLEDLLIKNPQKYIEYNIRDCYLVDRIEEKRNLLKMVIKNAYTNKCNYEDVLGTVKPWDIYIHHFLRRSNKVIPQIDKKIKTPFEGGYVVEQDKAKFEWFMTVDVKSSYPHQIMSYNLSPETFVEKLNCNLSVDDIVNNGIGEHLNYAKEHNLSVAANFTLYRKDTKGFMNSIMEEMFAQRAEYQKELKKYKKLKDEEQTNIYDNLISKYDIWQYATHIQLNSFYGMLANIYCRWYDVNLAEATTLCGQLTVKTLHSSINELLNRICETKDKDFIIGGDTDSAFISVYEVLKKYNVDTSDKRKTVEFIENFYNKIVDPYLEKSFHKLHKKMNSYQQKIRVDKEIISDIGIWTGKKHYIMNILSKEGKMYDVPQLKMAGIETVAAKTPVKIKKALIECIKIIVNNEGEQKLHKVVSDFKKEFYNLPFEDICKISGVSNIDKYFDKTTLYLKATPIHVRASINYNNLVDKLKLTDREKISNGDKIRYIYLRVPNPNHENVIATPDTIPVEFGLEQYIDRDTQYKKMFLDPLQSILDTIGWNTEPISSLEDFFT